MGNATAVIDRFEQGATSVENALRGLPGDLETRDPGPGKWSIWKIAAHIADAELVTAARLRWIAAEPGSALKAYDQDLWAENLAYGRREVKDSLALFLALRKGTATLLRNLPENAWSRTGVHEERGELSLLDVVIGATEHTEHHAQQINAIRAGAAAA